MASLPFPFLCGHLLYASVFISSYLDNNLSGCRHTWAINLYPGMFALIGAPGVLGIWGEGLFIFRELGSTANYFRGAGEQAHTFGDLGSTAKK